MHRLEGAEARRAAGPGGDPLRLERLSAAGRADLVVASLGLLLGAGVLAGPETVWPPVATVRTTLLIACHLYAIGWLWLRVGKALGGWLRRRMPLLLAILAAAVASALWSLAPLPTLALFAVGYVFWFGCHNLTESTLYRWNADTWMILVALMTAAPSRSGRVAPQQRPRRAAGAPC